MKKEKTPLQKLSTKKLVQSIRRDLERKLEEIGFEPPEGAMKNQGNKRRKRG